MTNKFKVGDIVRLTDECKDTWFYHKKSMKIIAVNEMYYYTDLWDAELMKTHGIEYFSDGLHAGITEECLELDTRENKLKRIFNDNGRT